MANKRKQLLMPEEDQKLLLAFTKYKDDLVFLDFITDQTENVYPMIAAGKGHHEMHLSPRNAGNDEERELA